MITATQYIGEDASVRLVGEVSKVDGDDFWLRYNGGAIKVDAGGIDMPKGSLSAGDKVVVTGKVDDHFFTEKDIDASSITRINMYAVSYTHLTLPTNREV